MDCPVRFVIELLRSNGESIGHAPVEPDWEPAIEWTRLAGLRTRGVWAPQSAAERGIEPLWHQTLGEPHMRGFRVHLGPAGASGWFEDFPIQYYKDQARAASTRLVAQGVLESGESFLYRMTAFARPAPAAARVSAFALEDVPPPLGILHTPLAPFMAASAPRQVDGVDAFPVFLPQAVLDEATALTIAAGESETGGFLIGHLHHAADAPTAGVGCQIFVEVTALLPARYTVGSGTKLTFTSDTWTDARATITLRGHHEHLLGWFHSHPQFAWCAAKGCSPEAQRSCSQASGFLSEDDGILHRTMFPRAFTLALLITRTIGGCAAALFGWQQGMLASRGFRVIGVQRALPSSESSDGAAPQAAFGVNAPLPVSQ
jgi:proteasome lid subunit RPN8/RPN11